MMLRIQCCDVECDQTALTVANDADLRSGVRSLPEPRESRFGLAHLDPDE
jgi:hypothetical protein